MNSRGQVIAGNQNWSTQVQGTDVDLPAIRSWPTKFGAFFTPPDVNTAAKVAVLGTVGLGHALGPTSIRPARSSASATSRSR